MDRTQQRKLAVLLFTAILIIGIDHLTKWLVVQSLPLGGQFPANFPVTIDHTENSGAAFGLFPQFQQFYLLAAVVVSAYILVVGPRMSGGIYRQVILGLILGGAVSNGIDRAVQGHVTDFIDFHFWPVFNLADTAIVVGMALAVLTFSRNSKSATAK